MISIDYFAKRMYCAQYVKYFESMAQTITMEYIEDAYEYVRKHGYFPEFGYFLEKTEKLSNELTMRARWMSSEYKEGRGGKGSVTLTTSFKRVIKRNVGEYIHIINTLKNIPYNNMNAHALR